MQGWGYWHFKPLNVCFFVFALELNVSYDVKTRDYFLNCVIYISKNNLDSLWRAILLWLFLHTYVPKTNFNDFTAVKNQKELLNIAACEERAHFDSGSVFIRREAAQQG